MSRTVPAFPGFPSTSMRFIEGLTTNTAREHVRLQDK